ncbi:hypothetical protein RND81_01G147900 [Saponaria officinalis]|uniref:ER lumen protein retaining receptor n=1 Tax=Saponaria officinalis TaxID=3572 RepID=A0AAW1NIU1_SAPOF
MGGLTILRKINQWIQSKSLKAKIIIGGIIGLISLVALRLFVKEYDHFFVASESIHALGILVLIVKLTTGHKRSCSGLSLKTQELTAIFLSARLVCSFMMENDIHTILDSITLIFTLWVIYMIRFNLKSTYIKELDTFPLYYVIVPCAVIALLIHPRAMTSYIARVLWSFCSCVEALSVLPQLRFMQNAKMVETFTAHYVFALGVARFLGCAHWIFQIYESKGAYLFLAGRGHFWILLMLLAEAVQTFILVDFCYYYVKRYVSKPLILLQTIISVLILKYL